MKKSIKKLFICGLTLSTLVVAMPSAVAAQASVKMPTDIADHWAKKSVEQWVAKDMGSGYPDGTFRPDKSVTRAEFASMANKAFGITTGGETVFSDCDKGVWYYKDLAGAYNNGYITGYNGGSVKPTKAITRQEAAVMLAKLLDLQPSKAGGFCDSSQFPVWATGAICAVSDAKIMCGYSDGSFKGNKVISRAEAVVALSKAVGMASVPAQVSSAADISYDKAGTYGGDLLAKTYEGNVTVASEGVVLKKAVIKGDLIIDKKVGSGNARIENVKVKGSIYVNGGGQNSVYLVDVISGKVYIAKDDGPVRIVISGTTDIAEMVVKSAVKVEETELKSSGIKNITVEKGGNGVFMVDLSGVTVESVSVETDGVTVKTDASTKIATFNAQNKVAITGQGSIEKLEVKVSGVTYEKAPVKTETVAGAGMPSQSGNSGLSTSSGHSGNGGSTVIAAVSAKAIADVSVGYGSFSKFKTVAVKSVTGINGASMYKIGNSTIANQLGELAYFTTTDINMPVYILNSQGDTLATGVLAVSDAKTSVSFDLTQKVVGPAAIADIAVGSGVLANLKTITIKSVTGIVGAATYKIGSSSMINKIGDYAYYAAADGSVLISIMNNQNNVIATGTLQISETKTSVSCVLVRQNVDYSAIVDVSVGSGLMSNLKTITVKSISGLAGVKYRIGSSSIINQTGALAYYATADSSVTIYMLDSEGNVVATGVLPVLVGNAAVNIPLNMAK